MHNRPFLTGLISCLCVDFTARGAGLALLARTRPTVMVGFGQAAGALYLLSMIAITVALSAIDHPYALIPALLVTGPVIAANVIAFRICRRQTPFLPGRG
jgi:hypothetical protein